MKVILAIGFLLISFSLLGQPCHFSGLHLTDTIINDSLNVRYFRIGRIPEPYKKPFYVALAHFPELSKSRIKFKSTKIRTTLNVRPTLVSIFFNSKSNRTYILRMNNTLKDSVITLEEIPFDALVGLFGHELCHIADYRSRNLWKILGRAIAYLSGPKKEKFEKEMDCMAIDHGLGCPLYQWSYFVLNTSDASSKYKEFKRRVYLKPSEIKEYINASQK